MGQDQTRCQQRNSGKLTGLSGWHHSSVQTVHPCTQEDEKTYQETGLAKLEQSVFMYIHLRWASFQLLSSVYCWFGFVIIDLARLTWICYGIASFFSALTPAVLKTM